MDEDLEMTRQGSSPTGSNSVFSGGRNRESTGLISGDDLQQRLRQSNLVQKATVIISIFALCVIIIIMAVTSATLDGVKKLSTTTSASTYDSLGLPQYEGYSWEDVKSVAAGSKVNLFLCGTGTAHQTWVNSWLIENLYNDFDITMTFTACSSTATQVANIEKQIERGDGMSNGTIDIIWINGANFYNIKDNGALYGPFATKLPSADNFDFEADRVKYDFGTPTSGYGMPYATYPYVHIANEDFINASTINNFDNFLTLLYSSSASSKGFSTKFTYAAPCTSPDTTESPFSCESGKNGAVYDYQGSAFIRHVFYYVLRTQTSYTYEDFVSASEVDETLWAKVAPLFYAKLRAIATSLYQSSGSANYPSTNAAVQTLYEAGTLYVFGSYSSNIGYTLASKSSLSLQNSQAFVFTDGSIANNVNLIIPSNAPNKIAALFAVNFMTSATAMFSRRESTSPGFNQIQAYDSSTTNFVDGGWNYAFDFLGTNTGNPTRSDYDTYLVPEIANAYVIRMEVDWYYCVLNYASGQTTVTGTGSITHNLYC